MGKWIDAVNSALAEFSRPGHALGLAMSATGASPAELGQAVRAIFGSPQPGFRPVAPREAAERLRVQLDGAALSLKDGLPIALHRFELQVAAALRGKADAQRAAGLILPGEFDRHGRGPHGHALVDPAGTHWADLISPADLYKSGGSWLVLGWPGETALRPFYRVEDVQRYTRELEGQRLREQAEHDAEERRRNDAHRIAWERSPAGRIKALEAELARLKGSQAEV